MSEQRRCSVCHWVGWTWSDGKRIATHHAQLPDSAYRSPFKCKGTGRVGIVGGLKYRVSAETGGT